MNSQIKHLLSIVESGSPADIQKQCSKVLSQNYNNATSQCKDFFLVSNIYYSTLSKPAQAKKTLLTLLDLDLNDRQRVECLGRLTFINLYSKQVEQAIQSHNEAVQVIQDALDNQKKSLEYILLWIYCLFKNPGAENPYFNLILAFNQESKSIDQSTNLLKKIQKQESNIDPQFINWKLQQHSSFNKSNKTKASQFSQMNKACQHIFSLFADMPFKQIEKDILIEKNKVLVHLKTIYNKYIDSEQYSQQLDFLETEIANLESDSFPICLFEALTIPKLNQQNLQTTQKILNSQSPITHQSMKQTQSIVQNNPQNFQKQFNNQNPNIYSSSYLNSNNNSNSQTNLMQSTTFYQPPSPPKTVIKNSTQLSQYQPQKTDQSQLLNSQIIIPFAHELKNTSFNSGVKFKPDGYYLRPPVSWIGSVLIKLNYTTDGQKIKFFYIGDPSKKRMYHCERCDKPDTKFDSYYDLSTMTAVQEGKMTKALNRKSGLKYDEGLCFSIILVNKTRDFIALNSEDYNYWLYTLRRFLSNTESRIQSPSKDSSINTSKINKTNYGSVIMSKKF